MPDNWWNEPISESILLKQGYVVKEESSDIMDILIENGIITQVEPMLDTPDAKTLVLDAADMYVIPGGIDPNTHFLKGYTRSKPVDNLYYGTRAAVAGGTTMIMDYVIPDIGESMFAAYNKWKNKAECEVVCDYGLHMAITCWDDDISIDMGQMTIAYGINSFMMYMGFRDTYMLSDSEIYQISLRCKELGALAMIHAENGEIIAENTKRLLEEGAVGTEGFYRARPEVLETEATLRACVIANQVKCPTYICNVMSKSAADIIAEKRKKGYNVFGETTAAALGAIPPPKYAGYGPVSAFITSPPISHKRSTRKHLMKLLQSGDLTTTASNNCSFTFEQKLRGKNNFSEIPIGVNGVEDRMAVVWQKGVNAGHLTPSEFVAVTSSNAAKLFNLYPRKGIIAAGSDADIVVWDPNKYRKISSYNHRQACDYNVFNGMEIEGAPEYVFARGMLCVDGNVLRVKKGHGNYVPASCFPFEVCPALNFDPDEISEEEDEEEEETSEDQT